MEQFGRILDSKWHFKNDKEDTPINSFKTKSTYKTKNRDAAIEIYFNTLEEKLYNLKMIKLLW